MAIGKSKKIGRKGNKKRLIDPLTRKEWFDFKAPNPFSTKSFGKTLVTKTTGTSKYQYNTSKFHKISSKSFQTLNFQVL